MIASGFAATFVGAVFEVVPALAALAVLFGLCATAATATARRRARPTGPARHPSGSAPVTAVELSPPQPAPHRLAGPHTATRGRSRAGDARVAEALALDRARQVVGEHRLGWHEDWSDPELGCQHPECGAAYWLLAALNE